jgi:hypothetical protein
MSTRQTETHGPLRGMASAMARPNGISMPRMIPVKRHCLSREKWKRSECSTSSNQRTPDQKNSFSPKDSWTE